MLLATFIDHMEMNLRFFYCNMYFDYTCYPNKSHAVISKDDLLNLSVVSV